MKKHSDYLVGAALVLLGLTACCTVQQAMAQESDFDTEAIHYLGDMFRHRPQKITIERVPQETLQKWYRDESIQLCMGGRMPMTPGYQELLRLCRVRAANERVWIEGHWVRDEKDPTHLHIVVYQKSALSTVVHEFLHWHLFYSTDPAGLVNTEQMVRQMTTAVVSSHTFRNWVKEHE